MIKPVAIDKNTEQHASLNFEFLRSAGIALIQQMAGKTWTDYNLHDPGITILEQLCYGITDLAYRTDFPIRDLLANEKGVIDYEKNAFFPKEEILTTNPITINDYRKVIIDEVDEVENVWLYPVLSQSKGALKGLYKIVVQVKREVAEKILSENSTYDDIINLVRRSFVSKRNLCEDIVEEIIVLKPVQITIEADIQIEPQGVPEEILADIYRHLENSLNLPVRYYGEKEMLDRGYSIDEIYSGPFLKKGFIPERELNERKTFVDPTELIKTISQVTGVMSVKKLRIVNGRSGKNNKPYPLDEFSFPLLDIKASEQHIKLSRDNFEVPIKRPVFRAILQKIREAEARSFIPSSYITSSKNLTGGKYHNNERYHSIQNQFPRIYGIGPEGLVADAPDERKAQAKQLKAYLLFFEQIMANYLSQLANINNVFSADVTGKGGNAYFINPLYTVPNVSPLFKAYTSRNPDFSKSSWEAFKKDKNNPYVQALSQASETDQAYTERKNRLLDHLFARFNEFTTAYPIQIYNSLFESNLPDEKEDSELTWKSDMLKNIAKSGAGRVRAFNYLEPDNENFDFEWKMRTLLHIDADNTKKELTSVLDAEHITVEYGGKKGGSAEAPVADENELSWFGDMPKILINKKEINGLAEQQLLEDADDIPHDAFLFKRQDVNILRYALDIRNFRVGPDPVKKSGFVLLYKAPNDSKWKVISRFSTPGAAMKSLNNFIAYIKNVNIKSEGFYLVEHILLRPRLTDKIFGFRFIAGNGETLMEHSKWMSFDQREDAIKSLTELLSDENEITPEELAPLCNFYPSGVADTDQRKGSNNLFNYFKTYAAHKNNFLSGLEMVVKGEGNRMISEDFFSLRMSVVFPSWPARFQDKNFREIAENLFRLNSPAYVKINFIWMNVLNLKKFEALYYDWKRAVSDNMDRETQNELRNMLAHILYKHK
jgi:hypothetical protein